MNAAKNALVLARRVAEDERRLGFARIHAKESVSRMQEALRESTGQFRAAREALTPKEREEFEASLPMVLAMVGG